MEDQSQNGVPYTTVPSPPPISSPTPQPIPMYSPGIPNQYNSEVYQQSYAVIPQPGYQQQQQQPLPPGFQHQPLVQPLVQPPIQPQQQVMYQPAMNEKPMIQATTTQVPGQQGRFDFKTAVPLPSLGMNPAPVDCPMCHARKMTVITAIAGNTTHAWAGILFCFTIIFTFVPYIMNSMKDVQHRCGNCGMHLATWHKSGQVEVFAYA